MIRRALLWSVRHPWRFGLIQYGATCALIVVAVLVHRITS